MKVYLFVIFFTLLLVDLNAQHCYWCFSATKLIVIENTDSIDIEDYELSLPKSYGNSNYNGLYIFKKITKKDPEFCFKLVEGDVHYVGIECFSFNNSLPVNNYVLIYQANNYNTTDPVSIKLFNKKTKNILEIKHIYQQLLCNTNFNDVDMKISTFKAINKVSFSKLE